MWPMGLLFHLEIHFFFQKQGDNIYNTEVMSQKWLQCVIFCNGSAPHYLSDIIPFKRKNESIYPVFIFHMQINFFFLNRKNY